MRIKGQDKPEFRGEKIWRNLD